MSAKTIALILMGIIFLWKLLLHVLSFTSDRNPMPENVKDIYDAETYDKWRHYHHENGRLVFMSLIASTLLPMCLLAFDALPHFALGASPLMQALSLLVIALLLGTVIELPFSWWSTMVIEQKYGFNRSTVGTFIGDQIKEIVIGVLLMGVITALLLWLHTTLGDGMILLFAGILFVMMLCVSFLFPYLSHIFNKFTPLEEGELRDKLTALMTAHGYHVRDIQVMDASRRTTRSNAYIAGLGKTKTIVLYDTMVASATPEEICAVFSHEMGHGLHHDNLRSQALSLMNMVILALLSWWTVRTAAIYPDFGFPAVNYGLAVFLLTEVELPLVNPIMGLIANAFSRRAEYRADEQAVKEGYGEALKSALKKLGKENFSNLAPSPLLVKLEYSHPTLSQRLTAIDRAMAKKG